MEPSSTASSGGDAPATDGGANRRGFVAKLAAGTLAALGALVPAVTGIIAALSPLRWKGSAGQPIHLASLESLPEDGTPRKLPVVADRTDAWNRYPSEPIGAVFLRRTGEREVKALQVICPHAGCSVQYVPTAEGGEFFCPCHNARFNLDGERLDDPSPSPRSLDELEVLEEKLPEVWVKFQNFRTGTARKIVEG